IQQGAVSTVGQQPPAKAEDTAPAEGKSGPATKPAEKKDEAYWRKRFGELHEKLSLAEKELDVMQRELNLNQQQFYSDPQKAMEEQYSRKDITEKTKAIDAKKLQVAQLKQQLSDLQDELRRAGGDPAWGR
ncbi:MAG: hypothetical protein ACRD5L_02770, partial [Bryobacteraceae bacterium]